ncbi:MAG TPA: hypothetical protein VGW10_11335 [Solirubrobacteraceae bacterium]|nr:hypothetical protein [Solirubrobacteraceae bacterium]
MAKQTVALYTVTSGDRVERARTSLAEALGDARLGDPDDAGVFQLAIDAESPEEARKLVREAFGKAGTGDDFVIRETTEGREIADDDPRQGTEGGVAEPQTPASDAAAPESDAAAPDPDAAAAGSDAAASAPAAEEGSEGSGDGSGGAAPDRAAVVADAASAVAAAATGSGSAEDAKAAVSDVADSARSAAESAAESVRSAAESAAGSVRSAVDEKGVSGAASDYASAAGTSPLRKLAPIGGFLLALVLIRRRKRR